LELDEDEWSASRLCRFTQRERAPGTHWIGGRVGLRGDLDDVEKRKSVAFAGIRIAIFRSSAHSLTSVVVVVVLLLLLLLLLIIIIIIIVIIIVVIIII
jgi:Flp pilus assembly protein TadB